MLNSRTNQKDYSHISITISENLVLENLSGYINYYGSYLNNLKIKHFNLASYYALDNSSIEGGNFSANSTTISNSALKNVSIRNCDFLYLSGTTLEDSNLTGFQGCLEIENSTLKNITVAAAEADLPAQNDIYLEAYPYKEFDYSKLGRINISSSRLENLSYKGSGSLSGQDVTLVSKIDISGQVLTVDLDLHEENKSATSLDLAIDQGTISLNQKSPQDSGVTVEDKSNSYSKTVDKAKA